MVPEQASALRNSVNNVPEFKNKMARQVLKAITKPTVKSEQIPSLLVAASFGGDFHENDGSPNADKGVKDLRRRFEDNEADIITELYARHFKNQTESEHKQSRTERDDMKSRGDRLGPDDSIEDMGFGTDAEDPLEENKGKQVQGDARPAVGAPRPETYSQPLQDKIKYVQYIPKDARGTLEDAVNQLYH